MPDARQEAHGSGSDPELYRLRIPRAFVRAGTPEKAERIFARFGRETGLPWEAEVIGVYWKDSTLIEVSGVAPLEHGTFSEAAVAALDALSGVVTLSSVRVDAAHEIIEGLFVAGSDAPSGTRVAGLDWLHFEIGRADRRRDNE